MSLCSILPLAFKALTNNNYIVSNSRSYTELEVNNNIMCTVSKYAIKQWFGSRSLKLFNYKEFFYFY